MLYGSLVELNVCLELYWDLVMNECNHCTIKLQLDEFLFFFYNYKIIAVDDQSLKKLLTSNCLSV